METIVPAVDLTAASISGPFLAGCTIASAVLDLAGKGETATNFSGSGCNFGSVTSFDGFSLTDYSTPGTYTTTDTTLVVTAVAAPEPSSLALIPFGLGALLLMRRRMSRTSAAL